MTRFAVKTLTNTEVVEADSWADAERKAALRFNPRERPVVLGEVLAMVPDYGFPTTLAIDAYIKTSKWFRGLTNGK